MGEPTSLSKDTRAGPLALNYHLLYLSLETHFFVVVYKLLAHIKIRNVILALTLLPYTVILRNYFVVRHKVNWHVLCQGRKVRTKSGIYQMLNKCVK